MKRALYILLLITVAITTLCLVTSCFTKAGDDDDDDDDDNDDGGEGSAPEVLETTPDDGDIEVSLGVVIRIKFSTRMDKSSVEEAISSDPVLEGDFEWSGNGEELIFIPSDPLDENSQYDVFISDKALDHEGNELGEPYVFGFQTVDLWSRKFGGQSGGDDEGHGIAVDSTGNVYVTGAETMAPDDKNVWVRKYNKKGDEIWTDTEMGTAGVDDYGHGVAYGGDGEIYVAGYIVNLGEGQEVWLRKYNSQGGIDWTETHNGSANGEDIGTDVAVDEEGNAYVTGWESVVAAGSNVWVRKYNSSGGKEWTETHNGVAILDDGGMGIALGPEGMVHVAGYETSLRDGQDLSLIHI